MSKYSAKHTKLDPNNLHNSVGNISVKFSDANLADTDEVWSSAKVKDYIDHVAQGLDPKASCRATTDGELPACTYDNGTSGVGASLTADANGALPSQDGVSLVVGDRLLVRNQSDKTQNGIYKVLSAGSATSTWKLQRATDFDDSPDGEVTPGAYCFIEEGASYENTGFVLTTNGEITIGTTELEFSQFTGTGSFISGVGLTKTGQTINIGDGNTGNKNGINRTSSDIGIATGIGVTVNNDVLVLSTTAAGDGLAGGTTEALRVQTSDIVGHGLEEDGSNDIRISSTIAGDGIQGGSGSALAIDVADFAGDGLEESGGDLRISSSAAGNGLTGGSGAALSIQSDTTGGTNLATVINVSTNGVAVKVDDSTITEDSSGNLSVADNGINQNKINSSIAGDGIQGGSGTSLGIDVSDFAGFGLEDDGSEDLRIASTGIGDGLTGGSGTVVSVQADTTGGANLAKSINVSTNGVAIKIDNSTIDQNTSEQLRVADAGITEDQINTSVAGNGLTGGGGSALAILPSDYITGGVTEIDGDKLDIDYTPSAYTPSTTPTEVTSTSHLTAHLYGIDQMFADISNEQIIQEMHKIDSSEDANGYFTLSKIPTNDQSVRVTIVEGNMQMNNAAGNFASTGETPDFEMINLTQLHFNNNGEATGLSELIGDGDTLIIEYQYEIETGVDGDGNLMPYIGEPDNANNIFEENGPAAIMPTTSGTEHDYFEIIDGNIVPKE